MTLTQLRYVLSVARHLSFVRAAEECHVAQPSLSTQIKKLEDELGTAIFDRNQKGVRLTEVGDMIVKQAQVVLSESERLSEIAAHFQNKVQGVLRLGLIPTVAPYLTPYFLKVLSQQFPDLEVKIFEETTENLMRDLGQGQLDAAILSPPAKAPYDLIEKVLYYEPFVIFANPSHHFLKLKQIATRDLSGEAPVLLDETHCLRDQVEGICHTKKSAKTKIQLQQGTLLTLVSLVNQQDSYTLLPLLAAERLPREQRQRQVREFSGAIPNRKISMVFHKSYVKRSLLEALEKLILENLPESVEARLHGKMIVVNPQNRHFKKES